MKPQSKISEAKILKATAELTYWINDLDPPLHEHIAYIHNETLDLLFATSEEHGKFIDDWIRLGTRQELQQVSSILEYVVDTLNKNLNI